MFTEEDWKVWEKLQNRQSHKRKKSPHQSSVPRYQLYGDHIIHNKIHMTYIQKGTNNHTQNTWECDLCDHYSIESWYVARHIIEEHREIISDSLPE